MKTLSLILSLFTMTTLAYSQNTKSFYDFKTTTLDGQSFDLASLKGKKVLVWYGGFKHNCSLFPTATVIEQFKEELKDFATSKGSIQFPLDSPLPARLIRKLVKARLAQSEGKGRP